MVRPPHLPPSDKEAKRKWKLMNRPSIEKLFLTPRGTNNFIIDGTGYNNRKIYKKPNPFRLALKKYQNLQDENAIPEKYMELIAQLKELLEENITDNNKARVYRMMGEIYLINESKKDVLYCFKQALNYNPKVGIKRSYEKIKKEQHNKSTILISEKEKLIAKNNLQAEKRKKEETLRKQKDKEKIARMKAWQENMDLQREEEAKLARDQENKAKQAQEAKLAQIQREKAQKTREKENRRKQEAFERKKKEEEKIARRKAEETELAQKLFNEKNLDSQKILKYLYPYRNQLMKGITRPKLSNLLGITERQCKIILKKLISDRKASKRYRLLKYSKYYINFNNIYPHSPAKEERRVLKIE